MECKITLDEFIQIADRLKPARLEIKGLKLPRCCAPRR
jgi:hypothetical protein